MVRLLTFLSLLLFVTSCDVYYLEPRVDERDEIVGQYDIEEFSATYNDVTRYTFRIEKSGYSGNDIFIKNFYGVGIRVYATLLFDRIDIPRQVVDGYEVEGVGTIFRDEISFNYRVRDTYSNNRADFCETTAWRY